MKRIKYILLLLMFIFIPNVNAETNLTTRLECPDSGIINGSLTCTIKADIDGEPITKLNANVCITYPGNENCESIEYSGFNDKIKSSGTNLSVGIIEIAKGKITKSGNLTVSLILTSGTSISGDVTFSDKIINKQVKILNNDAKLSNLTIDGNSVIDSLDKEYVTTKSTAEINAVLNDKNASIKSGTGTINLACGKKTYSVATLAEDKLTSNSYKMIINRTCDDSAVLKEIKLSSGALNPLFSSAVVNYSVSVSKDINKISITPVPASEKSTVKINNDTKTEIALEYGNNEVTIEVTSEKGTSNIYTISINREDGRSNNNYLSSITLSSGKILFSKETLVYDVKVLNEVTSIEVNAVPELATSKVEVIKDDTLKVGDNLITIKVTSEKGEVNEYKLNVTRLEEGETLGDNPKIKDIVIEGYDLDFNSDVKTYTLNIDKEDKLDIKVYMEDETATYTILDNENLKDKSVITIKTLSEDGSSETYKIIIKKSDSILILVIAVLCVVIAVVLIIIIIKNKSKDSDDKVTTNVVKNDKLLSKIDKQLDNIKETEYNGKKLIKEAEPIDVEEYKICSLCGHKIAFETKICPYCKKDFSKSTETL